MIDLHVNCNSQTTYISRKRKRKINLYFSSHISLLDISRYCLEEHLQIKLNLSGRSRPWAKGDVGAGGGGWVGFVLLAILYDFNSGILPPSKFEKIYIFVIRKNQSIEQFLFPLKNPIARSLVPHRLFISLRVLAKVRRVSIPSNAMGNWEQWGPLWTTSFVPRSFCLPDFWGWKQLASSLSARRWL